ncbi:MAG: phosphatase PAP2 family protein [Candidatus Pacebacteria bacterium]|nr:phosphatase PAP2 family protein [Candidatus Paceibacterota bacterium]
MTILSLFILITSTGSVPRSFAEYFAVYKERARHIFLYLGTGLLAGAVAYIGKVIFRTGRPFEVLADVEPLFLYGGGDSFPSGHALVFFALAYVAWFHDRHVGIFAYIVAVLITLARVIAGIHFPVDIIGGAILGTLLAYGVVRMYGSTERITT